jgi:hypothetical protein
MPNPPLDVRDGAAGIALIPVPVEVLGGDAELDEQVRARTRIFESRNGEGIPSVTQRE